jgi:UDP-glucose 4-epimerase
MQPKILVLGGAGYVGSHMVRTLRSVGYLPLVIDDLSGGFANSIKEADLIIGSIADQNFLRSVFSSHSFSAVMHFASHISVGESVNHPGKYYSNNLISSIGLLDVMREFQVNKIIFSSTAAVYGNPLYSPIDEKHPTKPINPYGRTKLMVEDVLKDYELAYGLRSVCLRYFNAAGADPEGFLGERHDPETHLIPLILQTLSGRRDSFYLFGDNYNTPDGTCIRDYVHVNDLCSAHLLALNKLLTGGNSSIYNLGYGVGYSIREVIEIAEIITDRRLKYLIKPKREGDSPELVANANLCRDELGWSPKYADLKTIIKHAWQWEQKYPWQ